MLEVVVVVEFLLLKKFRSFRKTPGEQYSLLRRGYHDHWPRKERGPECKSSKILASNMIYKWESYNDIFNYIYIQYMIRYAYTIPTESLSTSSKNENSPKTAQKSNISI